MKNLDVIVLTGKKFSGKDTLADHLKDRVKVSFGDQHKEICSDLFPFLEKDYPSELKESPILPMGLSPRDVWVKMNVITEIYPRISVDRLQEQIEYLHKNGVSKFVITDLRQSHEYDWVIENGFPIIKIEDGTDRTVREDELEDFIDTIETPYSFTNMKTYKCKFRFSRFIDNVKR